MNSKELQARQDNVRASIEKGGPNVDGNSPLCFWLSEIALQLAEANENRPILRDQFAMAAMVADAVSSGLIAAAYIAQGKTFNDTIPGPEDHAQEYYKTADDMLKARTA